MQSPSQTNSVTASSNTQSCNIGQKQALTQKPKIKKNASRRKNLITNSKLTVKQAKFVKEYISSNGNATQAAAKSYDTTDYATQRMIGCDNLTKPNVIFEIRQAAADLNLTPKRVLSRLNHILDDDDKVVAAANVIINMTGWSVNKTPDAHVNVAVITPELSSLIIGQVRQAILTLPHQKQV